MQAVDVTVIDQAGADRHLVDHRDAAALLLFLRADLPGRPARPPKRG